jgi:hypothetical protein
MRIYVSKLFLWYTGLVFYNRSSSWGDMRFGSCCRDVFS